MCPRWRLQKFLVLISLISLFILKAGEWKQSSSHVSLSLDFFNTWNYCCHLLHLFLHLRKHFKNISSPPPLKDLFLNPPPLFRIRPPFLIRLSHSLAVNSYWERQNHHTGGTGVHLASPWHSYPTPLGVRRGGMGKRGRGGGKGGSQARGFGGAKTCPAENPRPGG